MSTERSSPQEESPRGGSPEEGLKIGRALEQARNERGLSLKQAEQATKIRAGYLGALEREDFDVLPAVYVRGSLKTYANFLQLDVEAFSRELKRRQEPQDEPQDATHDDDGPAEDRPERAWPVPGVLAGVFAGFAGAEREEIPEEGETAGGRGVAGPVPFPAGASYLYLGLGALLVLFAVASVLALTLLGNTRTLVAQVREPLASKVEFSADTIPLRAEPFRSAGGRGPESASSGRGPERREEEEDKREKRDGRSEQTEKDKDTDDATQKEFTEPADQETLTVTESPTESYVAQEPQPAVVQASPVATSPSPAASAPSPSRSSTPSSVFSSASSSAPPSSASAPSPVTPPSTPAPSAPAVTGGSTPGGAGETGVPPTVPNGAEMADEIIEAVDAEVYVPAPARGGALQTPGPQASPGPSDEALPGLPNSP